MATENEPVDKNLEYVKNHIEYIKNLFLNKFIVVVNEQIEGSFDTHEMASRYAYARFGRDADYLIYEVSSATAANFVFHAII